MLKQILVAFFLLGGLLALPSAWNVHASWVSFLKTYFLMGTASTLLWVGNEKIEIILSRYFSWTKQSTKRFIISIFATVAYTFLALTVIVWLWQIIFEGNFNFKSALKYISFNTFEGTLIITLLVSALVHGRGFLKEWKKTLIEAEQLKKEHISAKYEALKNQVNPHFLFNSLNILSEIVHKDADLAEQFIHRLAKVYRYILETRDREMVSINEEVQNLESYIFLMKIRFGDGFNFENQLTETKNMLIAPLTLQMLVENALKHNETSKTKPLTVTLLSDSGFMEVRNNLQKKSFVLDSTGLGLENIRARYKILSGMEIQVSETAHYFSVKIPILK